jgi:hypothetical protein
MDHTELLGKARVERQNNVNILHLYGTPYQMGYQHGTMLAKEIDLMVHHVLLATAAYVAAQTGTDLDTAMQMLIKGQKKAYPFLPPESLEEMQGIYDGAIKAGASVTMDDILLWNTNYDQWCIYAHPHYWPGAREEGAERLFFPGGFAGGCSSFCAWDEWAGGDGKLIFGKNEDNFNMPDQLENRFLIIAAPKDGFGHAFMTYPGMIGLDGGFNDQGFEMMTQLNSMQYESMEGCGIGIFTRLLLTHAATVDDAIGIFNAHPRCAGIAYHVAEAKAKKAAVVETSSTHVCVRYPMPGIKALWQSNHSNCYPGWQGYSGYNMVADQVLVNELSDISTVEAWQTSLKDPYNFFVQAPSRFERYEQLIHQYFGQITVENAKTILTDCYDPYSGQTRPRQRPSWTNNVLCTICAMYPDFSYVAKDPVGPFKAHVANMWSMIAYPETGDFWLAANDFPAQYGGYEHFNLKELLGE